MSKAKTLKPAQPNNETSGLVALLKHMRQNEPRSVIIQNEIEALTALGSKLVAEETNKENRVKGKATRYGERRKYTVEIYRDLKKSLGRNPPLKVLAIELNRRYPERPKTKEDPGFKKWTTGGIKDWLSDLNKGKNILGGT